MAKADTSDSAPLFQNRLKNVRVAKGLSQGELAAKSGITRQAVSAIEAEIYLPSTAVALKLAAVLACRVEDLFSLAESDEVIEGIFIGDPPVESQSIPLRVKVARVGSKTIVRPVTGVGDVLSYTVPADGYLIRTRQERSESRALVRLSRDSKRSSRKFLSPAAIPQSFLPENTSAARKSVLRLLAGRWAAWRHSKHSNGAKCTSRDFICLIPRAASPTCRFSNVRSKGRPMTW